MRDLEYFLSKGYIDKIQSAYLATTVEERRVAVNFALLTSTSFVICLDANPEIHCDDPHSECFVASIKSLKRCFGKPIKIIRNSLVHTNVSSFCETQVNNYIDALEHLREAEFAIFRSELNLSYQPFDDEWTTLLANSKKTTSYLKKSEHLNPTHDKCSQSPLEWLALFLHREILAINIELIGLGHCSVEELRAIPEIIVVFPMWITLKKNVKTVEDITRILKFIRERHSSYEPLLYEDCVQLAPHRDHRSEDIKTMQNIPAWQWCRISLLHAWIRNMSPSSKEVLHAAKTVQLSNTFSKIMAKLC